MKKLLALLLAFPALAQSPSVIRVSANPTGASCTAGVSPDLTYQGRIYWCDPAGSPDVYVVNSAGAGDVLGPASSTTDVLVAFADGSGKVLKVAPNPANCSAGQVAGGINASGVAESCLDPIVSTEIDTAAELAALMPGDTSGTGDFLLQTAATINSPTISGPVSGTDWIDAADIAADQVGQPKVLYETTAPVYGAAECWFSTFDAAGAAATGGCVVCEGGAGNNGEAWDCFPNPGISDRTYNRPTLSGSSATYAMVDIAQTWATGKQTFQLTDVTIDASSGLQVNGGRITKDLDRDALVDSVECGDWNRDGVLSDADIDLCADAITDAFGLVKLGPGAWDIDLDFDGLGESYCNSQGSGTGYANPQQPHVCLRSGIKLEGSGKGVTFLRRGASQPACGADPPTGTCTNGTSCQAPNTGLWRCALTAWQQALNLSPLIGNNVDGTTVARSTARTSGISISELTLDGATICQEQFCTGGSNPGAPCPNGSGDCTGGGSCVTGVNYAPGVGWIDTDDSEVYNVRILNLSDAAAHFTRSSRTVMHHASGDRIGNFDTDGALTGGANCDPVTPQDGVLLFTSRGWEATDSGFSDVALTRVGGRPVHFHGQYYAARPAPFGEASEDFDSTNQWLGQTFRTLTTMQPSGFTVWLKRKTDATVLPTGNITASIYTTTGASGSEVPNTVVTGLDGIGTSGVDVLPIAADKLTATCQPFRFDVTSTNPANLTTATYYAVALKYTAQSDAIVWCRDDASTDTYDPEGGGGSGGRALVGGTTPTWTSAGTGFDFNFEVEPGQLIRPFARNISVDDVPNANGVGDWTVVVNGSIGADISGINATKSGGLNIGVNEGSLDAGFAYEPRVNLARIANCQGTQSATVGLRIGAYSYGAMFSGISVSETPGQACFSVDSWAHDFTLRNSRGAACGQEGLVISGGVRNARFFDLELIGSNVTAGASSDGITFKNQADTDGTGNGFSIGVETVGLRVFGVPGFGIDGNSARVDKWTLADSTVASTGLSSIRANFGTLSNSKIVDNQFLGCAQQTASGDNSSNWCLDFWYSGTIYTDNQITGNHVAAIGGEERWGLFDFGNASSARNVFNFNTHSGTFASNNSGVKSRPSGDLLVIPEGFEVFWNGPTDTGPVWFYGSGGTAGYACGGNGVALGSIYSRIGDGGAGTCQVQVCGQQAGTGNNIWECIEDPS